MRDDDRFHDECGVFGIYGHAEAANLTYLGLHALQHRGQESAGIVSSNGERLLEEKGMDPQYYLLEDDATDLPYRDIAYADRMGQAPEDIGLARHGSIAGYMSERTISPLIDSIRNEPRKIHRLCFPAETRALVERRLRPFISHERQ